MICEICGKKTDKLYTIIVDGAILHVCEECKRYGKEIGKEKKEEKKKLLIYDIAEEEIDENYYRYLREYREKNKLTQEEMAKILGIKVSLYRSLEEGKIRPDMNLAKKIEKKLGIKIIKKIITFETGESEKHWPTIGDVINIEDL